MGRVCAPGYPSTCPCPIAQRWLRVVYPAPEAVLKGRRVSAKCLTHGSDCASIQVRGQ